MIAWKEFFYFRWFEFDTSIIIICCISLISFFLLNMSNIYLFMYYTFIYVLIFSYLGFNDFLEF